MLVGLGLEGGSGIVFYSDLSDIGRDRHQHEAFARMLDVEGARDIEVNTVDSIDAEFKLRQDCFPFLSLDPISVSLIVIGSSPSSR